jgi:cobalt-zinc-cadmium efflux system outer membrane protein
MFVSALAVLALSSATAPPTVIDVRDDPPLVALIEEALARSPDLHAAREMALEAQARPAQARALPEPMLSVGYVNEGAGFNLGQNEFTTLGFFWSQDLPYPGKRRLRGDMREREAEEMGQRAERARLDLVASVRRAYHDLIHAREVLELQREQEALAIQVEDVARERYAVGQGGQQDVLRAQVEVTRSQRLRAEQAAEEIGRLSELNRLRALPPDEPFATPGHPEIRPLDVDHEGLRERVMAASPELRAALLARDRDRLGITLARKDGRPDFTVQGGYQNRGGLDGMWQVGFGLRLPLWRSKVEAGIAEAEARLRASEQRVESVRLALWSRTRARLARARATEEAAVLVSKGLVPQDRLAYEAALASYQAGRTPFSSVLDALGALYRDRAEELGLLSEHQVVKAELDAVSLETPARSAMEK